MQLIKNILFKLFLIKHTILMPSNRIVNNDIWIDHLFITFVMNGDLKKIKYLVKNKKIIPEYKHLDIRRNGVAIDISTDPIILYFLRYKNVIEGLKSNLPRSSNRLLYLMYNTHQKNIIRKNKIYDYIK